jgi:hypothetical protein
VKLIKLVFCINKSDKQEHIVCLHWNATSMLKNLPTKLDKYVVDRNVHHLKKNICMLNTKPCREFNIWRLRVTTRCKHRNTSDFSLILLSFTWSWCWFSFTFIEIKDLSVIKVTFNYLYNIRQINIFVRVENRLITKRYI